MKAARTPVRFTPPSAGSGRRSDPAASAGQLDFCPSSASRRMSARPASWAVSAMRRGAAEYPLDRAALTGDQPLYEADVDQTHTLAYAYAQVHRRLLLRAGRSRRPAAG